MEPKELYVKLERILELEADEGTRENEELLREYSFLIGTMPDAFSYDELKGFVGYVRRTEDMKLLDEIKGLKVSVDNLKNERAKLNWELEKTGMELENTYEKMQDLEGVKDRILETLKKNTSLSAYLLLESEIEKLFS